MNDQTIGKADIATLEADNKRLREALEFYADRDHDGYDTSVENYGMSIVTGEIIEDGGKRARQALKDMEDR